MRQVFQRINREVWIVTAADNRRRGGLTATWVSQASLDDEQPTVMVGIGPDHFTCELIQASRRFGLHLLKIEQTELALRFALSSGRDTDKLAGLPLREGTAGAPLLGDCLAWLDCQVYSRLVAGDRVYFWADILGGQLVGEAEPLREQALIAAASPGQRQRLRERMQADVAVERQRQAEWRAQLPEWLR